MTLDEQWQEDVKQFGELAYLMWAVGIKTHHDKTAYLSCLNNFSVESLIDAKADIRRKNSAALPFDLAAAMAGDEVEYYQAGEWEACRFVLIDNNRFCVGFKDDWYSEGIYDEDAMLLLRMKHPRRVGVDYSKFEDER